MTERKPPGMSLRDVGGQQISRRRRAATSTGLPGAGSRSGPRPRADRLRLGAGQGPARGRGHRGDAPAGPAAAPGARRPAASGRRGWPPRRAVRALAEDYNARVEAFWRRPAESRWAAVPGLADVEALVEGWERDRPGPGARAGGTAHGAARTAEVVAPALSPAVQSVLAGAVVLLRVLLAGGHAPAPALVVRAGVQGSSRRPSRGSVTARVSRRHARPCRDTTIERSCPPCGQRPGLAGGRLGQAAAGTRSRKPRTVADPAVGVQQGDVGADDRRLGAPPDPAPSVKRTWSWWASAGPASLKTKPGNCAWTAPIVAASALGASDVDQRVGVADVVAEHLVDGGAAGGGVGLVPGGEVAVGVGGGGGHGGSPSLGRFRGGVHGAAAAQAGDLQGGEAGDDGGLEDQPAAPRAVGEPMPVSDGGDAAGGPQQVGADDRPTAAARIGRRARRARRRRRRRAGRRRRRGAVRGTGRAGRRAAGGGQQVGGAVRAGDDGVEPRGRGGAGSGRAGERGGSGSGGGGHGGNRGRAGAAGRLPPR